MEYPVSIFIMDVTKSRDFADPDELTEYLESVVGFVENITEGLVTVKVKQRLGDEIVFVGEQYETAYVCASMIQRFWKYREHMPYFGITFGKIEKPVDSIQYIDTWNHPLVSHARGAAELLKSQPVRHWMHVQTDDRPYDAVVYALNDNLNNQQVLTEQQTENQREVSNLFFFLQEQKAVAERLGKSKSTISTQIKQGYAHKLIQSHAIATDLLRYLEQVDFGQQHPRVDVDAAILKRISSLM